ncbi:MAG TPA: immune inhibitor A domain-containing protein [Jiangellaceae bacterium]
MRSRWSAPAAVLALLALLAVAFSAGAGAGTPPAQDEAPQDVGLATAHDLPGPMTKEFEARREAALELKLRGEARGKVARLGKNKYVELVREKTDPVFVIIAEFGNARHSSFCDAVANPAPPQPCAFPSDGSPQRYDGPLHNQIDPPNRAIDNSTLWQADYNAAHYENMYFNRLANYFEQQSSNRYSVVGEVNGWVKVPFNEARYGRDFCGSIVCNNTWFLIRDAMSYWVQGQLAAGKTDAQIADYLKTFDKWDRYDLNGNGNFDEPDGFIDHFQIVHAGGDQAAGDPHQGTDAIWSHRWYAAVQGGGPGGLPGVNIGSGGASGGLPGGIPNHPLGVWVGDYTIQPENGGLGVFVHEYAHDLGLPDLYDTSGNTGGAENSTGFWTLMSSGANIGDGGPNGIGDAPTDLGAWEKFQLGWLGCDTCAGGKFYETVAFGERQKLKLGPNDAASKLGLQAAFALLPDKRLDTVITAPKTGSFLYWSTMGDEINTSMTKAYTVPAGATLTADVWYDIEEHFDYAFLEQSTNGGTTWTPVLTNLSDPAANDQSGFNASGTGITGSSAGAYRTLTATLPGSGASLIRFRYQTDQAVTGTGFAIDNIAVTGSPVDGAEDPASGWTFDGFKRTTGTETSFHLNAYVMENRQYDVYDRSLRTAYNFGFLNTGRPDWVEHFPYQDGLLISYWDETFTDNSVGDHPGGGLILPVDAHPSNEHYFDGQLMRARIQSYDSTFGLDRTDSITIHKDGVPTRIRSKRAVRVFDDLRSYWIGDDGHTPAFHGRFQPGWASVKVAGTGTRIRVNSESHGGRVMHVEVNPR